ncbi:family 43 glycosylhydrolase [bacterium]
MKKSIFCLSIFICYLLFGFTTALAQNPLILDQFTADPSARVFEGKVYVYPSHDILAEAGKGRVGWFCMPDYHVFSSENLTEWMDHGVIVSQNNVNWVDSTTYSMWAPDCIEKDDKYYFYFPAIKKAKLFGRGMAVGVAVSDTPYGPFIPESKPIEGVSGIDPNPFIDKDGQVYLYWAAHRHLFAAKLKDNMKELATEPQEIQGLPEGFKEGPYVFERNGNYYFTFPYVANETEQLDYAMGNNPLGPFEHKGLIMDESPTGCWTNHHSIIEYKDQWLLFYHHNDLSPHFDKNRSVRADSLFFNEDGTIQQVYPTFRGVGITQATQKIQIDRYTAISNEGTSVVFLDTLNRHGGWKTVLKTEGSWIQYNSVDFNDAKLKSVNVKVSSITGSVIHVKIDQLDGPVIAKVKIPKSQEWSFQKSKLKNIPAGIHNLFVVLEKPKSVEIDWVRFK